MTELLQKMITELEQLPEADKNAIISRFLAELKDEKALQVSFNATTEDIIDLVDQWLAEDSDYDQEVYPQLEVALSNQSVSIQANWLND
jgi:hypothetical protein